MVTRSTRISSHMGGWLVCVVISSCSALSAQAPSSSQVSSSTQHVAPASSSAPLSSPPVAVESAASEFPVDRELRSLLDIRFAVDIDARNYREYQRRIAACMSARGFEYTPITADFSADAAAAIEFNPLNEKVARQFGYHSPPAPSGIVDSNVHSADFDSALNGIKDDGSDGCAIPSIQQVTTLTQPLFEPLRASLNSFAEAIDAWSSQPESKNASEAWSSCMSERGISASTPEDLRVRFLDLPKPSKDELDTRLIDLSCDKSVGLTAQRSAWQTQSAKAWIDNHSTEFSELERIGQAVSERLAQLESETL